jgi:hypothetical protein
VLNKGAHSACGVISDTTGNMAALNLPLLVHRAMIAQPDRAPAFAGSCRR